MQGLGFLESGITDPLNHFSNTLLEFSALLRHLVGSHGLSDGQPLIAYSFLDSDNYRPVLDSFAFDAPIFARQQSSAQASRPEADGL